MLGPLPVDSLDSHLLQHRQAGEPRLHSLLTRLCSSSACFNLLLAGGTTSAVLATCMGEQQLALLQCGPRCALSSGCALLSKAMLLGVTSAG